MTNKEQPASEDDKATIAYLRDLIDKINTVAYDHQDAPFMDYIGRLTRQALYHVPPPDIDDKLVVDEEGLTEG